jgi:class 3 adenylate cyclase
MVHRETHSEQLTIMMLDLCSYTHISSKMSRHTLHELHDLFDDISIPSIEAHHGTVIKKIGDAFLATFKSPTNALHCAVDLQTKFREYNRINRPRFPLSIKIALHSGEVILRDNDIYGDAVNITARIESAAESGQILFSGSLHAAMNKNEIGFIYLGRRRFKGVKFPVKMFRVKPKHESRILRRINTWSLVKDIAWLGAVLVILYFLFRVAAHLF